MLDVESVLLLVQLVPGHVNQTKFYRVRLLGGRSGKRIQEWGNFLNWITEDALLQVFSNWQKFSAWVMDNKPEYIHGGHLIDMLDILS